MNTQDQARALMMRHHHLIKNRQQSMQKRSLEQMGMPGEGHQSWNHIQGKPSAEASTTYDRSGASLS